LVGQPMMFHHAASHSAAFAVIVAVLLSLIPWTGRAQAAPYRRRLALLLIVALSHPFLDLLTYDKFDNFGRDPYGLMLAWPFSSMRWGPVSDVFPGVFISADWRQCLTVGN